MSWSSIKLFFSNLFSKKIDVSKYFPPPVNENSSQPVSNGHSLETEPKTINLAYNGTLKSGKWAKTITLPVVGKFVVESHYATVSDKFGGGRQFPNNDTEGIYAHLKRASEVLGVSPEILFESVWERKWTPPENGKAGQGAVGDQKPTDEQEMWQGNMMWANGHKPTPGTKFLVEANGKACVIQMGFETGPGEQKFLGGFVPEVHWFLGTDNSSQVKLSYLKNQSVPLGPVKGLVHAPEAGTAIPNEMPWLDVARKELGQSELSGSKHNKRIIEYHKATTLKASDDETAWCSSFVCWVLETAGFASTRNAWARSFLDYGTRLIQPQLGCIVVFKRGSNSGHVGFWMGETSGKVMVLSGNQDNMVKLKEYYKSDVLGYRWPVKKLS